MPYERTKNWRDTQADIAKLFGKYAIGDTQWSISDSQKRAALSFIKGFKPVTRYDKDRRMTVEIAPAKMLAVRMDIPLPAEGPSRNQAFRALYYYLKSKLEAVHFRFEDGSELFNFEREFFGHTVIVDDSGRPATAFDAYKAGAIALAAPNDVIALGGGKT